MRYTAHLLNEEEIELIHRQSLQILFEVGVKIPGEKILPVLEANGARVDHESHLAFITTEMVEQAVSSSPKSFVLGARNPGYDFKLPSITTRYALDGTGAFTVDFLNGNRRYGEKKDIIDALRIFQYCDMGVMAWPPVCASDKPANSRPLHEFFAMIQGTSKHGQHELLKVEQVPYLIEGLETVARDSGTLRKKNMYSLIYCPVAPLTHDGAMLEAYIELGQIEMPIMIMPMPVCGMTGPASLYSNIAMANAEALSSFVIFQMANPGRPLIYSSATGMMDFRTGAYLAGTVESGLQSAALVQMGKYYDLPTTSAGMTSDAKEPGPQAVIEKTLSTIPSVQAGSDIIVGFGEVESNQTLYLEQILVDNEIAHLCERIVQGVNINPETDLSNDIAKVGPGGHFLATKSTRSAARSKEFYRSNIMNHHSYENLLDEGKPSFYSSARDKVEEILSSPVEDSLPEETIERLDAILRRADRELAE